MTFVFARKYHLISCIVGGKHTRAPDADTVEGGATSGDARDADSLREVMREIIVRVSNVVPSESSCSVCEVR